MKIYTTKSRILQKQQSRRAARRRKRKRLFFAFTSVLLAVILIYIGLSGGRHIGEKINEIKYPIAYSSYINKYSKENDIDPHLVLALIKQESNFIADARSEYAGGLMQLTEITATEYAQKLGLTTYNYMDPETNIQIGCYVLGSLIKKYDDIDTALAAYNAGVGNVDGWLKNPDYSDDGKTLYYIPFSETRHYVKNIKQYVEVYKTQVSFQPNKETGE